MKRFCTTVNALKIVGWRCNVIKIFKAFFSVVLTKNCEQIYECVCVKLTQHHLNHLLCLSLSFCINPGPGGEGETLKRRWKWSPAVPGSPRKNSGGLSVFKDILVSVEFLKTTGGNPNWQD